MNFYEQQIESLTRRIKKIEESPNPIFLKCNKMIYELERETAEHQLDAMKRGKPFGVGHRAERLLRAMGFQWQTWSISADRSPKYAEYKPIIERQGFPEKCCDRAVAALAMMDAGDIAKPHVIVDIHAGCDALSLVDNAIGRWFNIPMFHIINTMNDDDDLNLDNLNFIVDQFGELIEWLEKTVPGVKYDEAKHIEIQKMDGLGRKYLREIYQLRKHVPCPIAPLDAFRIPREPSFYWNMQKAVEYFRICRDEMGERVASGKGPYPEERLRLFWTESAPFARLFNPFKVAFERKVAVPLLMQGSAIRDFGVKYKPYEEEVSEYGVKLSPLQEDARWIDRQSTGSVGKRWVDDAMSFARDLGVHGIVDYLQVGCTPVLGLSSILAERAEKELGIPVLRVEGRQMDKEYRSEEQWNEILSSFIDKCFDWAGKPRQ